MSWQLRATPSKRLSGDLAAINSSLWNVRFFLTKWHSLRLIQLTDFFDKHPEFTKSGVEKQRREFEASKRNRARDRALAKKREEQETLARWARKLEEMIPPNEENRRLGRFCHFCQTSKDDVILGVCPTCAPTLEDVRLAEPVEALVGR
jgi:hypothetical protein